MGKIAFLFAGQGAQYSGMGLELAQCSEKAAKVFEMADKIRPGTSKLCFEGSKEELQKTENTQPSMFCVGFAAAEALREKGIKADCIAGFSAGEVAALACGGYLEPEEAFKYIIKRAENMKLSSEKNPGLMFAVIGLDSHKVKEICKSVSGCYPVNFNTDVQTSVACTKDAEESFQKLVSDAGGKTVKLSVSGGFHSPMMDEARARQEKEFKDIKFNNGIIPVYANVSARPYTAKEEMFSQINSPVLWNQTILNMVEDGVDTFVELGPGRTLSKMILKIYTKAQILNVEDKKSLENTVEVLKDARK